MSVLCYTLCRLILITTIILGVTVPAFTAENSCVPITPTEEQFLKLQQELIATENRIQAARRFYNGNVRDYRNKCETFPSNLVAQMFGFQPQEFFSVPPSVKEVPDVEFAR